MAAKCDSYEDFRMLYREAHTTELLSHLDAAKDALDADTWTAGDPSRRLKLQGMLASLYLVVMNLDAAATTLSSYVRRSRGHVSGNAARLSALETSEDPAGGAMIFAALANLLYRQSDEASFKEGLDVAERASRLFDRALARSAPKARDRLDLQLAAWENRVWRARLVGHVAPLEEAEAAVQQITDAMNRAYDGWPNGRPPSRLGLLLAIALDLGALIDWRRGRIDVARRRIYRGLFLLTHDGTRDHVRLGYLLYSAARIEAAHTETGDFPWARHLATEAATILGTRGNHATFCVRASLVKAQSYIKSGQLDQAEHELAQVTDKLENATKSLEVGATSRTLLDGERRMVDIARGEFQFTRILLLERRAEREEVRTHARHAASWKEAEGAARELLELELPERLKLEAKLHLGRCLTKLPTVADVGEGKRLLEAARAEAAAMGRVKTQAAAVLSQLEHHAEQLRSNESARRDEEYQQEVAAAWRQAEDLVVQAQSTFLKDWLNRLSSTLRQPLPVNLNAEKIGDIILDVKQMWAAAQVARDGGNVKKAAKRLGVPRATLHRYLKRQRKAKTNERRTANVHPR